MGCSLNVTEHASMLALHPLALPQESVKLPNCLFAADFVLIVYMDSMALSQPSSLPQRPNKQ